MSVHQHGSITVLLTQDKTGYTCPICAHLEEIETLKMILDAERDVNKKLTESVRRLQRAYDWMAKRYKTLTGR